MKKRIVIISTLLLLLASCESSLSLDSSSFSSESSSSQSSDVGSSIQSFRVSFDSRGGTDVGEQTIVENGLLAIPTVSKTGHTLEGWYTSINQGVTLDHKWDFFQDRVQYDFTLYAAWTINQYTLSFITNGALAIPSRTIDYGSAIDLPTPTKTGHAFAGWHLDESLSEPMLLATMPDHDVILYAKWTINQYTLTFNSMGGTSIAPITVDFGTTIERPEDPTKTDYLFLGWFYAGGAAFAFPYVMTAGSFTIYAHWEKDPSIPDTNTYRITGNFYEPGWETDAPYILEKDPDQNVFVYEGLDFFVDEEWVITINGAWAGQIGFDSLIDVVDPEGFMGPGADAEPSNFKVLTEGNYDIELNTGVNPRVLTIIRNGDPIEVVHYETNPGSWHLTGTMNDWELGDPNFELVEDSQTPNDYVGSFDLDAGVQFKIASSEDILFTYARGSAQVQFEGMAPAWLDLSGEAITIAESGAYEITFEWIASVDETINGTVMITQLELPVGYTSIADIIDYGVSDNVLTTRGVVVGTNGGSIFIEDPVTQKALNVYESPSVYQNELPVGSRVDVIGTFKIYNNAPQLNMATIIHYDEVAPEPVVPYLINQGETLTDRLSTDTELSGQLVRLENVTVGPVGVPSANRFVITMDGVTVKGFSFYSPYYESATPSTGRSSINAIIDELATSGESFDIIGVLYHASEAPGSWALGLGTDAYIIRHVA